MAAAAVGALIGYGIGGTATAALVGGYVGATILADASSGPSVPAQPPQSQLAAQAASMAPPGTPQPTSDVYAAAKSASATQQLTGRRGRTATILSPQGGLGGSNEFLGGL